MLAEYQPIIVLLAFGAFMCTAMVGGSWLLGPKKSTPYKEDAYECGVQPVGDAKQRFAIKYYLTAILFVLFDIEVVFLWSWLTVFKNGTAQFQVFSGIAVLIYMVLWIIGDVYAIKAGAIEWDESNAIAPEKLAEPKSATAGVAEAAQGAA